MAAAAAVTPTKHSFNSYAAEGTYVQFTAATGVAITWDVADERASIFIKNASTDTTFTAVIAAGNGIQGVGSLSVPVPPASVMVVPIESGRFKNVSGTDKGKVMISDSNTTNTTLYAKVEFTV